MIFEREALYTLGFLAGSQNRIFGVPCPMDDDKTPQTYKEMISKGMVQLEAMNLIKDGNPTEHCDRLVFIMSEYLYKGDYFRVDQFHFATHGSLPAQTSYIEEVKGDKYRLNSLMKATMVAGIMSDNLFLAKLEEESVDSWIPESFMTIQLQYSENDGIVLEALSDFKQYHLSTLIDDKGKVLEFDILNNRRRNMSASAAVLLIITLMNIKEPSDPNKKAKKEAQHDASEY